MDPVRKSALVKKLLECGKAKDLLELALGESKYSNASPTDYDIASLQHKRLHAATLEHLKFLAQFGDVKGPLKLGSHIYSSYPEEFQEWLHAGAPGIPDTDIERYSKGENVR